MSTSAAVPSEVIAQQILDRQVALIRKDERALLGLGFAGEILAHAWLDPDALEQLAARSTAIATEIRKESRPAPKRKPRAAKPVEPVTRVTTPEPTLIELAKARNRAQVERLKERLAGVRAA